MNCAVHSSPSIPGASQLGTHQMRQESTAAVQVFPAEVHPAALQLRVNLPDEDDGFISASAVAIENQNAVDLPPSYQECCPTLPMSSRDKRVERKKKNTRIFQITLNF